jgi:hypothetical protein
MPLDWKSLIHFMAIWNIYLHLGYFTDIWDILRTFGIFYDHLVHFSGFGIMQQENSGNPLQNTAF